jgi:histone acetyltransferase (RNA polymerase elongator complex component)
MPSEVHSYEIGPIRPPSEGQDLSLLLRVNRNCPWNRCEFCPVYKGNTFEYRSISEVKEDIHQADLLKQEIKETSWKLGYGGRVNSDVIQSIIQTNRAYRENGKTQESLINMVNFMLSGERTVFLQDANALIMRTLELSEVIRYVKQSFPQVQRITSYARSKTCQKKSLPELLELREAGLSRIHVGLESGCDEVLEEIKKGVRAEEHIQGGRKIVETGISLSEYVMPGLGGRRWTKKHALETARALNSINPDYIRLRSLIISPSTPLYQRFKAGEFEELSEDEMVEEIGLFLENLDCSSYLVSDHIANLLPEIEGQLPQDKKQMLNVISNYKSLPLEEKLKFRLERRLHPYLSMFNLNGELKGKVNGALKALDRSSPEAERRVDEVIHLLRHPFV